MLLLLLVVTAVEAASLPSTCSLKARTMLNCEYSQLTDLRGFPRLKTVKVVDLSFNFITDVHAETMQGRLPRMQTVILTGNPMEDCVQMKTKSFKVIGCDGSLRFSLIPVKISHRFVKNDLQS